MTGTFLRAVTFFSIIAQAVAATAAFGVNPPFDGRYGAFFPAEGSRTDSIIDHIPRKIEAWMEKNRHVSLSVAIVLDRDIIYSQAFGYADLERNIPATTETMYPIASITKVFTATMLAQLCERGIVNLETQAEEYIPEYGIRSPFPGTKGATLRQLASHTAGLPKDSPLNFWSNYSHFGWIVTGGNAELIPFVSKEELLEGLGSFELEHWPGIYSHYSNLGFQILGIALERASGQAFTDYIRSHILEPLGMNHSGFMSEDAAGSRTAPGYVCLGRQAPFLPVPAWQPGCALYSGGLYSTAEDMTRFLSLQFQEKPAGGAQILSAGSLRAMRSPSSVREPGISDSYGLGWAIVRIADRVAIEHNGGLIGHSSHVSAIPGLKIGVVVLSNSRNHLWSSDGCGDLARGIHRDLAGSMKHPVPGEPAVSGAADPRRYEGLYVLQGGDAEMVMKAVDGRLVVSLARDPEFNEPFVPLGPYEFCFEDDPSRTPMLFFQTGDTGEIVRATFLSYTFIRRSKR